MLQENISGSASYLLSLNHLLVNVKDRKDLLGVINEHLKKIVYFSYCSVQLLSEDRKTFSMFLLDPTSLAAGHANYNTIVENHNPADDDIFNKAIVLSSPHVWDIEELILKTSGYPAYVKMFFESGIKEVVTMALWNGREKFGLLTLCSDNRNNFRTPQLKLIEDISHLVSMAASAIIDHEQIRKRELEKEILLCISNKMAGIRDKNQLLPAINDQLKNLFYFNFSSISVLERDGETFTNYSTYPFIEHPDFISHISSRYKIKDGLFETFLSDDEPVISDYEEIIGAGNPPFYCSIQYRYGMKEAVSIRLMGEDKVWGVLHFFSDKKGTFTKQGLPIIKGVASQVTIAISNLEANEGLRSREKEKEALLAVSHEMAKIRDKNQLLTAINTSLKNLFYFTHSSIAAINEDRETFSVFLTDPKSRSKDHPEFQKMITAKYPINDGLFNEFFKTDEPTISDIERNASFDWAPRYTKIHYEAGLREAVSIPMYGDKEVFGILTFYSDKKKSFTGENLNIIKGVANQVAVAVSNILAHEKIMNQLEEINSYRKQLELENLYLQEQIDTAFNHAEIIGDSPAMQRIYHLLSQVSTSDTTVLILGETGTGKELVARALHNSSSRSSRLMIKVNCAALPANLIESELFGHERGSFTGATERRIGKFEMANNSTLFLDEIGELSQEMQVKLLRVLQEREIERVGGQVTIKINVRIITATNRNLMDEVIHGRFRSDLYYRLNVFPVELPPLRERKEDIPQLVNHFISLHSRNAGKHINSVSAIVIKKMMAYAWPGNVRELEHIVERTVLLAQSSTIRSVYLPVTRSDAEALSNDAGVKSINEMERDHILNILKQCNGKIQGIGGAAELLKIPPTTLHSKMKKLGIKKIRHAR